MRKHRETKHHRKPRSIGGSNDEFNISILPQHFHDAWHLLFYNMEAEAIAKEISTYYLDPDYIMVAVKKEPVCDA